VGQPSVAYEPRRGRPTRAESQARHAALLDVALDLFLAKGYEQATIEAIAANARATKRTIYARYPDKAALFHAAVAQASERYALPYDRLVATDQGDLAETLVAIAWLRINQVRTPNGLKLQRIINTESYRFPELFTSSFEHSGRQTVEFIASLLKGETTAGRLAVDHPTMAATVFMSMVVGGPVRTIVLGSPMTRKEIDERTKYAVQLFLDGARTR
jgi:TetR/AcrR family transcriptional regulator, mexJK operon transcriptional repressor